MVKHTEKIRWWQPTNCLIVFDHFFFLREMGEEGEGRGRGVGVWRVKNIIWSDDKPAAESCLQPCETFCWTHSESPNNHIPQSVVQTWGEFVLHFAANSDRIFFFLKCEHKHIFPFRRIMNFAHELWVRKY